MEENYIEVDDLLLQYGKDPRRKISFKKRVTFLEAYGFKEEEIKRELTFKGRKFILYGKVPGIKRRETTTIGEVMIYSPKTVKEDVKKGGIWASIYGYLVGADIGVLYLCLPGENSCKPIQLYIYYIGKSSESFFKSSIENYLKKRGEL